MSVATDGTVSVCIDKYEFPGFGRVPETLISQGDANTRCVDLGKRLCTEAEWRAACRGPSKLAFPYGDGYQSTTCNTSLGKPASLVASGTFVECKSAAGVYDLAGNAAEWIAEEMETMGGSAAEGDDGRCASKDKRTRARDENVGFRCCMTPRVGL
jgi:formylglycine-generating enzyme required for sulfatase activity